MTGIRLVWRSRPQRITAMNRPSGRAADELRAIVLEPDFVRHADGSCMARFGDTHVLCTATIENRLPPWLRGRGGGWLTAEYGMLPGATHRRTAREASRGRLSGRTQEIQRLIGRSLRAVTDLDALGERQIMIDCDVIQADGGTRTASITGAFVALHRALAALRGRSAAARLPLRGHVAAVSCGVVDGVPVLDLDYAEDSSAHADANFVMTDGGALVEVQATAENAVFDRAELDRMLDLAASGIAELAALQKKALGLA